MGDNKRTIVGGRSKSDSLAEVFPRRIEVLLKKANVDDAFRELFLNDPLAAAESIELDLNQLEISMLSSIPHSILQAIINNTPVPNQHVRAFRTAPKAAALILLLGTSMVVPSITAAGTQEEVFFSQEQFDLASENMASIQYALDAYKRDYGSYPSTEEWLEMENPLNTYLTNSNLFDPWYRKFHYEDYKEGGQIVSYRLESFGLDIYTPVDNIPCPNNTQEHLFLQESPITILYPGSNHRIDSAGMVQLKADHDNPRVIVNWYLDGKKVGQTVGENILDVRLSPGTHTLKLVDENNYSAEITFSVGA